MIAYDIGHDKRRKAVHDTLQSYGIRVQYSVFECRLDHNTLQQLRQQLVTNLDANEDSIRCYPLCAWCQQNITSQGIDDALDDTERYLV